MGNPPQGGGGGGGGGSSNLPNWQEDGNSPFTASSVSSKQFTLASDWDRVLLLPTTDNVGFDQVQVNGDTGSNYDYVDNSDTLSTDNSEWDLGSLSRDVDGILLQANQSRNSIGIRVDWGFAVGTGLLVAGANVNVTTPINTFTLINSFGNSESVKIEAYGLNVG